MDSTSRDQGRISQRLEKALGSDMVRIFDTPKEILRKILCLECITSDIPLSLVHHYERLQSVAWREEAVKKPPWSMTVTERHSELGLRAIGWGSCGIVYEQHGTSQVLKRAVNNGALAGNCRLWNELIMHMTVEESFARCSMYGVRPPAVHVPRCAGYISKGDKIWWAVNERLFPKETRYPENLLRSERIPPIHMIARHALICEYCPEGLSVKAMLQDSNKDCLIRLYLGRRRHSTIRVKEKVEYFSLRNFKLCLDQMEDLELDSSYYALQMADVLAIMHWEAQIDAADVEFVLGGPPCLARDPIPALGKLKQLEKDSTTGVDAVQPQAAATHMWLLDFNQCQPISMDEEGVHQAVKRFFDNDPYYPRPSATIGSADERLWEVFAKRYLETSGSIIGADKDRRRLPITFIEEAKEAMRVRLGKKDKAAKRSDLYTQYEASAKEGTPETAA